MNLKLVGENVPVYYITLADTSLEIVYPIQTIVY